MNKEKIDQRLKKCRQALGDAYYLLQDERYLAAVNRMYYAAFYAITAFFASKNWVVKTHSGVKSKVYIELTSQKLITIEESKTFDLLSSKRHEFDYDDEVDYNVKDILHLYEKTKEFIIKIESLIIND